MPKRRGVLVSPLMTADPQGVVLALLAARVPGATVCPSEAARVLAAGTAGTDWRAMMPTVHAAIDGLVSAGRVRLTWKGIPLPSRAGPYRIGRIADDD